MLFMVLALSASGILWIGSRAWLESRSNDLGWMSHEWLEEFRAGHR